MNKELVLRHALDAMKHIATCGLFGKAISSTAEMEAINGLDAEGKAITTALFAEFLARIDAERGKEVIGYDAIFKSIASATKAPGAPAGIEVSVRAFKEAIGGEIFLSATTIPLTDEQIDIGIREAEKKDGDCDPTDFEREVKFCEKAHGIAAAQGERK